MPEHDPAHWDTVILSDIHLGINSCRAKEVLEFLSCIIPGFTRNIYLNGDIFDGWGYQGLSEAQKRVVDKLLDLSRQGVNTVYVPGNHDELLRELLPVPHIDSDVGTNIENEYEGIKRLDDFRDDRSLSLTFNDNTMIEIRRGFVFEAADKRRYLFQHLDQFDDWMRNDRYLIDLQIPGLGSQIKLGNKRDTSEIFATFYESAVDSTTGMFVVPQDIAFSAQKWLKSLGKHASGAVKKLRKGACSAAHGAGLDGAIGGHIHQPGMEKYYASPDGRYMRRNPNKAGPADKTITYLNDGDWKETCSALVFDQHGTPDIIAWRKIRRDYGFPKRPRLYKKNPCQHMRPVTDAIVREIETMLEKSDPEQELRDHGRQLSGGAEQSRDKSTAMTFGDRRYNDVRLEMRLHHRVDNCIRQGIALNMPV